MLKKNGFRVPYIPKDVIQNWVKRGRERMRREGLSTDFKYFVVQEYGPKTNRTHFHVLFFGIPYEHYMLYFGTPWRIEMGWTKPVYNVYGEYCRKDFKCMTLYVSKYVMKGDFANSWEKEGILPRPYRLISKGIGEGYLNKDFFNEFKKPERTKWLEYHCPSEKSYQNKVKELFDCGRFEKMEEYKRYYSACRKNVDEVLSNKLYNENTNSHEKEFLDLSISTALLERALTYYDEGGYPHKLPIYYINKLFRKYNEKTIYQSEIQAILSARARLYDNKAVQEEVRVLGIVIPDQWLDSDRSTWKLSASDRFMVEHVHTVATRSKAETLAERRKTRLTNFYNRSKYRKDAPALE